MADTSSKSDGSLIDTITSKDTWNKIGNDISSLFSSEDKPKQSSTTQESVNLRVNSTNEQDRFRALASAYSERDKSSASSISNFSSNLWVSGANDQLAATDVYAPPKKSILSTAPAKQTSLLDDVSSKLDLRKISETGKSISDTGLLKDLKTAYSSVQGQVKQATAGVAEVQAKAGKLIGSVQTGLTKAKKAYDAVLRVKNAVTGNSDLSTRITGVSRSLGGAFSTFGSPLDSDTTRLLSDINQTTVTVGKVERLVTSSSTSKFSSIAKGLEIFTGNSSIMQTVDTGAKLFAGIGLVNTSARAGLPGVSSYVVSGLGSDYANKVAAGSLNNVARSSNVDALQDLNSVVASGVLKKINPSVLSVFAKAFVYLDTSTVAQKKKLYTDTIATFTSVDPNWCKGSQGEEETLNLTVIMNGSSQFKDLISVGSLNTDAGDKLLGFGAVFGKTDVVTELKKSFPRTVITENVVKRKAG
jgi:hypothetical protein